MPKEKLIQFLQKTGHISLSKAGDIADRFAEKSIPRNEFFLREGRISDEYLFLEEGCLRAFAHNTDGEEVTTNFCLGGQVAFEVSSFFNRTLSQENIQALTDCEGWYITYQQLNSLFHELPEFREFGRQILVNGFTALKSRMLSMITETAEERYIHLLKTNPAIFQWAPLKNIASFLGITDTSLSRIRKEFSKK